MLTVGIVALFQAEYTLFCLEQLLKTSLRNNDQLKIIVVLNGAKQEVIQAVRDFEKNHSEVFVIQNTINLGYAEACNQILEQTLTKYICFIHNDVIVNSRTLETLVNQAEITGDNTVGFLPLTGYANEHFCCIKEIRDVFTTIKPSNKSFLSRETLLSNLKFLYGDYEDFAYNLFLQYQNDPLILCQEMSSYCCLFRRDELRKIGGFNDQFYLRGFEDKEIWLRLQRAQYQVVLCRTAFVHHHGNLTTDGEGFSYPELVESQGKIYDRIFEQSKSIRRDLVFIPKPLVSNLTPAFQRSVRDLNKKPKRLLYFGSHYASDNAGGAELSAHETHKLLVANGVEVCAVCIRNKFHKNFDIFKAFDFEGVKVFQIPDMNNNDIQIKLYTILEQFQPQAIITHSCFASLALKTVLSDFPHIKRFFFFRHQSDILDGDLAAYFQIDGGTTLVSNSRWMQSVLKEQTGRDSELILPVIMPKSCKISSQERTREAVTIGNGVLSKGIKEFLSIAEALPDYPFHIWGSLDPKIPRAILPPNVHLRNWTKDLRDIYREAKIVVNLSVDPEPFGRTLIEALYNQIPVIAYNEGGPKEFIKHGGVLVMNSAETVKIIEKIYTDKEYYQKLCDGTVKDLYKYNPYRENAKLMELLSKALGEPLLKGCGF